MQIERISPNTKEWLMYYANHIYRYEFAKQKIIESHCKKILDAACGVGYGSYYLSELSNLQIYGIDNSLEALRISSEKFANKNIKYFYDDCQTFHNAIKYGPYDCIVSFETLEHLISAEEFLNLCYKNLDKSGMLIISTPNIQVSSPSGKLDWRYHQKEYTFQEFKNILEKAGFIDIKIYGQQYSNIGKLRKELKRHLHLLHSNPFVRLGKILQRIFKGTKYYSVVPEDIADFEIQRFDNQEQIDARGVDGPFVFIASAFKK